MKYQILKKIPLAAYVGYTAPTAERDGIVRTGYAKQAIEAGLSGGLAKENVFGYATVGYRNRTDIPDQVTLEFEVGTNIKFEDRQLYLMFHIDGALNTSETTDPEADESALYHNNGQFLSPGLKAAFNVYDNWWINIGSFGAFEARNQGAAATFTVGLAYNLKK